MIIKDVVNKTKVIINILPFNLGYFQSTYRFYKTVFMDKDNYFLVGTKFKSF